MTLTGSQDFTFTSENRSFVYQVGQVVLDYPPGYSGSMQIIFGGQCQYDSETKLETFSRLRRDINFQMELLITQAIQADK